MLTAPSSLMSIPSRHSEGPAREEIREDGHGVGDVDPWPSDSPREKRAQGALVLEHLDVPCSIEWRRYRGRHRGRSPRRGKARLDSRASSGPAVKPRLPSPQKISTLYFRTTSARTATRQCPAPRPGRYRQPRARPPSRSAPGEHLRGGKLAAVRPREPQSTHSDSSVHEPTTRSSAPSLSRSSTRHEHGADVVGVETSARTTSRRCHRSGTRPHWGCSPAGPLRVRACPVKIAVPIEVADATFWGACPASALPSRRRRRRCRRSSRTPPRR